MTQAFAYFATLAAEFAVPEKGILSRTLLQTGEVKIVGFAMAAGEALSEHTSSRTAIIQVLEGQADMTVGRENLHLESESLVYMQAHLPHSLVAKSSLRFMLYLLGEGESRRHGGTAKK